MSLGTNRDNIATVMTAILFIGGVAVLSVGISAYQNEAFVLHLDQLIESISGGKMRLDDFDSELRNEPYIFMMGGGVLMFIGVFGLCSVASGSSTCRQIYLVLLLLCFAATIAIVVFCVLGCWAVDLNGENDAVREEFRSHWLNLTRPQQIEFEELLQCCDFDNDSPRRNVAVWLGGCRSIKKGCFIELLLVENAKKMASVFIWSTVAFVILFFFCFNCMVDHAEI